MKQAETPLPAEPQALRVINQQLYCCCYGNGIVVFDSELQRQRNIQRPDMGYIRVYDIAVMSSGDAVVATRDGLLHNVNGKWTVLRMRRWFHHLALSHCTSAGHYMYLVASIR